MNFRAGGLVLIALSLASPALAETAWQKHHKVHHVRVAPVPAAQRHTDADLFPGSAVNVGSDNRYFTDTRQPLPNTLGPGIFQKFQ